MKSIKSKTIFWQAKCPYRSVKVKRRGAGHAVTLVIALPFYMLVSVFAIEMLLLFVSHIALLSATDRVVHQVQDWLPHRTALQLNGRSLEKQVHREVCSSLLPYAITRDNGESAESLKQEIERQLQETRLDPKMVQHYGKRWERIYVSTRVKLGSLIGQGPYRKMPVTIEYDAPLWTPWFSGIFGVPSQTGSGIYVYTLRREVEVPILMSDWQRTQIGIPYDPFRSRH
jgi:hypothetical protein